jgi:translation initiation factor IF-3
VPKVRLIDHEGRQLGVVDTAEALDMSKAAGLDLVEVSPNAQPPVCRIMNHGKYLFEQSKRKAAQKKKQKQIQIKEIKFRPVTDVGDYQVKVRKIKAFLERGDKVKISIRFKGREMQHKDLGMDLLERIRVDLAADGVMDQSPRFEGRQITMIVGPSGKAAPQRESQ